MTISWISVTIFELYCRHCPDGFARPNNGLRECKKTSPIPALEVLPGGGWDNLRNLDMGRVMNFSYSLCQTTEDGVYLIPDEVFVIPQKVSGVEANSEIISSWLDQRSSTSHSINMDASFFSVLNAKFSAENKRTKTHQVKESSVTTRVQVRNHLYTVKSYPDFTLDSRFAHQAEEIADALENNQTRQAAYLSEKLVFDYGTHVVTSIDAGASLVQEDYVRASYVSDGETTQSSVTASAGVNFFNKVNFNFGSKDAQETSETRSYEGNITYSLIQSHGGALFYPGITLQKWQESTLNNLVAIDRAGLPLHYFLNRAALPDLPEPTVRKLARSVRNAVERYYTINTRPGCVKPDSKNFNFQANVDDDSCEGPATNLSFGGVYQTCSKLTTDAGPICEQQAQKNPDTGDFSCRAPFQPTLLQSQMQEEGYSQYECHQSCHGCWLFFECCHQVCGDSYHVRRAKLDTYWCATSQKVPDYSGYLFGGLYSPNLQNPTTKSTSCPPNFFPLKMLANGMMVCVSNDYEMATRFSVPFGGFFSCKANNPLARYQPHCPPGFSQHLAAISDGCQVLYCVQSGIFTGGELLPIHLPPFTRSPVMAMVATNTVAVMTQEDKAWVRISGTKMWKLAKPEEINKLSDQFGKEMSGGQKLGTTFGVIAFVALVIGVAVVIAVKKRKKGYKEIDKEEEVESQTESEPQNPSQPLLP
ncbi:macrophage-expressed gene 1 protein-like isoform X2 [Denticeps clupeoides]|uniref:macrophage-expressed gene 1 protein-like isoform X2 n=1 Tax=Denticeps clupeoides TaxID=299321 RepID=UPI0010A49523|nr:macrophage-expressed gene 1 protein-like isoform X2 [Denticeps clupeoides]XP_028852164.1 macrophage-expressed gene 1 protein-like isoform X2 [Denticeps clupeoides]